MDDDERKPVLGDHVRVKKKLISPLMNAMGSKLSQYSWTRQLVPEAVWMALVIDRCGLHTATKHCLSLILATKDVVDDETCPMFAKFSAFSTLTTAEKAKIVSGIDPQARKEIASALRPLRAVALHPLAFLDTDDTAPENSDANQLSTTLRDLYDRNGRSAVLSMALAYYLGIRQGKIHVAPHLLDGLIEDFKFIEPYPKTEKSKQAAGSFRASAPMLFMAPKLDGSGWEDEEAWVGEFWDAIAGFGPCLFTDTLSDDNADSDDPLELFVSEYQNSVRADLRARLSKWRLSLRDVDTYEVVAALLCRQATLAMELAASPGMWTPHSGPLILRAIADVFINLAWILKDPSPRSKQYIEDGLGAIKLQIAHQEQALKKTSDPSEIEQLNFMIELWRGWLTTQRMEQFVEVNLGSWSGLNTRKMAEEAGFLDFYNYVYQPFSGVAHSNWAHVSMFNTVPCENPAHRGHRSPAIAPIPHDAHWLFLATKYLSKTLGHFDEVNEFADLPHSAFEYVCEHISDAGEPDEEPPSTPSAPPSTV